MAGYDLLISNCLFYMVLFNGVEFSSQTDSDLRMVHINWSWWIDSEMAIRFVGVVRLILVGCVLGIGRIWLVVCA